MPSRFRCLSPWLLLGVFVSAGCRPDEAARVAESQATPAASGRAPARADREYLVAHDQPTFTAPRPRPDSVGVLVASPLIANPSADTRAEDFASGIGWYLTNAVAGAPELGQSPLYTTVLQASRRHRVLSLRMSPGDAARVARVSGATHIATGELTETAEGVTLRYQIAPVPMDEMNSPVAANEASVSATNRFELIAKLPDIAQKLRAALGVEASIVTVPIQGVSPELLAQIGYCADSPRYTQDQVDLLDAAGKTVPLVVGLTLSKTSAEITPYLRLLQKTMPHNTQALGISVLARSEVSAGDAALFYTFSDRFPNNYILAHSAALMARGRRDAKRDTLYTGRGVRNAPANTDAHLTAGRGIGEQVDRLRRGRRDSEISAAERAELNRLYAAWRAEVKVATECDPLYEKAHQQLARAAFYAGNPDEADASMTTARKLTRRDPYAMYAWAIEMYQPKGIDNPGRLREIAEEAANAEYYWGNEAREIHRKLGVLGFSDLQPRLESQLPSK